MWGSVATWEFALQGVTAAKEILEKGGKAMDAAEVGVRLVETDPTVESVGRGGFLNANGDLELDGAVMDGTTLKMGAVAGVRGYEHPVSIARAVMERTRHSIIVGLGAEQFAREQGFEEAPREYMVTETAQKTWEEKSGRGHDTIGLVSLDQNGDMAVAMSTSGASMKVPGRVGDTPIVGSGFYVETGVGGAACTGLGEDIMRTCCSFRAVDLMRAGMHPQKAAETVVLTAHQTLLRHGLNPDCIAIVCMNDKGEYGGSANHQGFTYAHAVEGETPSVVQVVPVIDKDAK